MIKILIFLVIIPLFAVASDSDMDGVQDSHDSCKNTPFWTIVNSKGCAIKHINHK